MAATEARAAWQRAANRCFVQEDAKRAPKLACCPSSSSTPQYDSNNCNAANQQEHPTPNFVPLNWDPMNSNLPPDTRWWLQLQPSFGCHKDFVSEQHNFLGDELEEKRGEPVVPTNILNREREDHNIGDYPLEPPWMVSTAFRKKNEMSIDERKSVTNIPEQPLKRKVDMGDHLFQDAEFVDWKPGDRLISKKTEKASPDLGSPSAGNNKSEPWWCISDRDELASLVAQKSLVHIENCDLPRPTQTMHGDPFACHESLDGNRIFSSSVSYKSRSTICDPSNYPHPSSTSRSMDENYSSSIDGSLPSDSEKLYSGVRTHAHIANDLSENRQASSETSSSRAQLLEALRHSQTRAREAEIAAQKAYNEKEHIVELFFRQASHLFAYKQWLQMLQLENLRFQIGIKEHQISTLFPVLPWMPLKGNAANKSKGKKQKKCKLCKYVAYAIGLGLAGAGLLLGCTLGCLLPHI